MIIDCNTHFMSRNGSIICNEQAERGTPISARGRQTAVSKSHVSARWLLA
jgi:hypothetical protein